MPVDYTKQRLNYDTIAPLYDEPLRDHQVDSNLVLFLEQRPQLDPIPVYVLDMGCGTGKQLAANRPRFPAVRLLGLDLFAGMLKQAQSRCRVVSWVQGDSAAPPFRQGSIHYITNQFSYQHVQPRERMIAETYRLLRPGGRFVMTNLDPWSMTGWVIYRYFPAARQRDFEDFLPAETFTDMMGDAGFININLSRSRQVSEVELGELLNYASQRFRTSQLVVLTEADYRHGLEKMRQEIEQAGGNPVRVKSELSLVTIVGDKP